MVDSANFGIRRPSVSVVISNFNYADYLRDAVESVRRQTYAPLDCIIVDDCSTDDSSKILDEIERASSNVSVIRENKNRGQSSAILTGLAAAKGSYILLLDADDILLPDCISTHLSLHLRSRKPVGFTCCDSLQIFNGELITGHNIHIGRAIYDFPIDHRIISNETKSIEQFVGAEIEYIQLDDLRYIPPEYIGWPWSTTSSMFFRRDALDLVVGATGFADIRLGTDHYLATSINALSGSLVYAKPLVAYRIHGGNGFMKRVPLNGFIPNDPADDHYDVTYRVLIEDLLARFSHYAEKMENKHRILEICAELYLSNERPDLAHLTAVFRKHREQLSHYVDSSTLDRWTTALKLSDHQALRKAMTNLSNDRRRASGGCSSTSDYRQRWSLPDKLGRWLKGAR